MEVYNLDVKTLNDYLTVPLDVNAKVPLEKYNDDGQCKYRYLMHVEKGNTKVLGGTVTFEELLRTGSNVLSIITSINMLLDGVSRRKLYWRWFSQSKLTEIPGVREEYFKYIDWTENFSYTDNIPWKYFESKLDEVNWNIVMSKKTLPDSMLQELLDISCDGNNNIGVSIEIISLRQNLSVEFIERNADKLSLGLLLANKVLNECSRDLVRSIVKVKESFGN